MCIVICSVLLAFILIVFKYFMLIASDSCISMLKNKEITKKFRLGPGIAQASPQKASLRLRHTYEKGACSKLDGPIDQA